MSSVDNLIKENKILLNKMMNLFHKKYKYGGNGDNYMMKIIVLRNDGLDSTAIRKNPDVLLEDNMFPNRIPNGESVIASDSIPGWLFVEFYGIKGWIRVKHAKILGISINASWATQLDVLSGTEKKFVEYCQITHGKGKTDDLPPCTKIWVNEIQAKNPAFIAIQEGVDNIPLIKSYLPNFDVFTKKNTTKSGLNVMVHLFINKLISKNYKSSSLASIYQNTWEENDPDRPIQIVWNTEGHYVVNCHAPHHLNKKKIEENITNALIAESSKERRPDITRVTAFGDFNDHASPPNLSSRRKNEISIGLKLPNKFFVLRSDQWKKTCCFPHYSMAGDYVLDTEYARNLTIFGNDKNPYSDHHGVNALIPLKNIL